MLKKTISLAVITTLGLNQLCLAQVTNHNSSQARIPTQAQHCFDSAGLLPAHMISGIGMHTNKQQAKTDAFQDISQQLSVQVNSQITSNTSAQHSNISNSFSSQAQLVSQSKLTGAKLECEHYSASNGMFYVLYTMDKRPPMIQLAQKLVNSWQGKKPNTITWRGNPHIIQSNAIKKLERLVTHKSDKNTQNEQVSVGLNYHQNNWYLTLNFLSQQLEKEDVIDFFQLPSNSNEHQLSIVNKQQGKWKKTRQLRENDEFKFKLSAPKGSYYQLVNIYQDGRVADLSGLAKMSTADLFIPQEGIFEAALLMPNERTVDIYLAIISDKPFSPLMLEQLQEWQGVIKSDDAYQLANLLTWLADKEQSISLSAVQVITTPR